jgi:hypothetical protein
MHTQQPDNYHASKRDSLHPTLLSRQLAGLSLWLSSPLESQLFNVSGPGTTAVVGSLKQAWPG